MSASAPAEPTAPPADLTSPDPDTPLPTYHAFPIQYCLSGPKILIHLYASRTRFPPRQPGPFVLVAHMGNPANLEFVATVTHVLVTTPDEPNTVDSEIAYELTCSDAMYRPGTGNQYTADTIADRRHWNLLTEQFPPPAFDAMYDPANEIDSEFSGRICNPLEGQVYRAAE
jgi:hypothetical protein